MLTTNYVPGAPIWADLSVPDTSAAAEFYQGLLGWEFVSAGPDSGGYGMFTLDGKTVAAAGPLGEQGAPAWSLYFHTPDVDATAAAVRRAGGTVLAGPMDVFTAGRMAVFADPLGDRFSVWQPGETKGLGNVTAPGTLCWTELHTSDPQAATAFYSSVFGWQTTDVPMGEGITYTLVRPQGAGEEASQGGIMAATGAPVPGWRLYFEVADCDAATAAAAKLGGTVLAPPMDVPMAGRIAVLADPAGAPFAIITSVAPEDAQAAG